MKNIKLTKIAIPPVGFAIATTIGLLTGYNFPSISPLSSGTAVARTPEKQANPTRASKTDITRLRRLFPQQTLLPQHTFQVNLLECGRCLFVPTISADRKLTTYLVKNNQIIFTFPESEELIPTGWRLSDFKAVSFVQLGYSGPNEDGIIMIADYITGIGRTGAKPFPVTMVYQRRPESTGFEMVEKESLILTERGVKTISQALSILQREFLYIP